MSGEMSVLISSVPDRDEVVAELRCGNVQWDEISNEQGQIRLEIYPNPDGSLWSFEFSEALHLLVQARDLLLGLEPPR